MTNTTLDGSGTPFVIPAGSTQQVNDGDAVFLLGTITNRGTLALNGTGTLSGPPTLSQLAQIVLASPTVTLTGGGTLAMTATSPSRLWGSSDTGETLVNADNTISGAGVIGIADARTIDASTTVYPIALVNGTGGVIDANGTIASSGTSQATFIPAQNLVISTGSLRLANAGLIEATGIGGVVIQSNAIDQSGGGTILSRGAGVIVTLTSNNYVAGVGWAGIDIIGGTLDATGGGAFQFDANGTGGTLDGRTSPVTLGAGVDITGGIRYLLGTIDNHGTIAVAGTVYPHNNIFFASPTITLTGGGTVVDPIFTDAAGSLDILVNVDNTISGTGMIGIAFVDNSSYGPFLGSAPIGLTNEAAGVINANGASGFGLSLFSGGAALRNDGLMQATGAGGLQITNVTLDQSGGGTLQAIGAGAIVTLQTVDVIGGLLASSGGGIIKFNVGNNTLTSSGALTISAGGIVEVISDRGYNTTGTLTLHSAVLDNFGTLIAASTLILDSPDMILEGGGTVQVNGADGVINTAGATALTNFDNILTGSGSITSATLALTNAAAGVINGITIDTGRTLINAGLLENVSVGLNAATTVSNINGGRLLASGAGAIVGLYNASITGGTLAASGGGRFQLGGGNAGSAVILDGRDSKVTIAAGTTLRDFYYSISLPFTFEASGNLSLLGTVDLLGTILGPDPLHMFNESAAIPNAGLLEGSGTVQGYLTNSGTLKALGGTMTVTGDIGGSGSIIIAPNATFVLGGASGQTVDFGGGHGSRLSLNTPAAFTGTLANLGYGDIISLGTEAILSAITTPNALTVTLTGAGTLYFSLSGLPAGAVLVPQAAAGGQVRSELVVACFAEGTRIRTPGGDMPVETLRAGDLVATLAGGPRPILWTGHRHIACGRHSRPQDVLPVRICAHAFGRNAPHTDLLLSPDHAVFTGGVLIPVRYLINGRTIIQQSVAEITYHHVELPAHDVLLAEGLPCESYLDTGNRLAFAGHVNSGSGTTSAPIMLHADFARRVWAAQSCAPLVLEGPPLHATRRYLLGEAAGAGHVLTGDSGLRVIVNGRALRANIEGAKWRVRLPPAARNARLVSRCWVPSQTRADEDDTRTLGVAICNLRLDGQEIRMDDARLSPGWQMAEPDWRWTSGDAGVALAGARDLTFSVAISGTYWTEAASKARVRSA